MSGRNIELVMKESKHNNNKPNSNCLPILILIICAISLFFYCIDVPDCSITTYGSWGNFIGGIFGTVIAGFACYYVYQTYISQCEIAKKQQFETIFLNLIRNHKECLKNIQYTKVSLVKPFCDKEENIKKRIELLKKQAAGILSAEEYKTYFEEQLQCGEYALYEYFNKEIFPELEKKDIGCLYSIYHHPWFVSIRFIIKYIDKTETKIDKDFYSEYLFAQMTKPELWILYSIYQFQEKMDSDTEATNEFSDMVKRLKLFDYGYNFLIEKFKISNRDIIYDKINI